MNDEAFEIFIHRQDDKPLIEKVKDEDVLQEVLLRLGVVKADEKEVFVFVGENESGHDDDQGADDTEDDDKPVNPSHSMKKLALRQHRHVHVTRCRRIAVEVNFQSKTKKRKFSPATTVGAVAAWARRKFRIDPVAASEYVLQLCNSTEQPRSDVHLGELVKGTCSLCFDLVKEVTPQGYIPSGTEQRVFEFDINSVAFRSGSIKGLWGLSEIHAESPFNKWPFVYFWLKAAPREASPERYTVRLDLSGYRNDPPTGTFWDEKRDVRLDFANFPKGRADSRFAKVYRTDWGDSTRAFYHPYDRVAAHSHPDWKSAHPHLVWTSSKTIVDVLEEFQSLLVSGDYLGNRAN